MQIIESRKSTGITLAALLAATAIATAAAPVTEQVGPTGLTLEPSVPWDLAYLVVSGPAGYRWEQAFEAGATIAYEASTADGSQAPDGDYSYELRLSSRSESAAVGQRAVKRPEMGRSAIHQGSFALRLGLMEARPQAPEEGPPPAGAPAPKPQDGSPVGEPRAVEHFIAGDIGTANELCIGCTESFEPQDEKLIVIDSTAAINLQDAETPTRLWEIENSSAGNLLFEDISGTDIMVLQDGAPANSLRVNASGSVGMGTSPAAADLHLFDDFIVEIRMENLFDGVHSDWSIESDEFTFNITDRENDRTPLVIGFTNGHVGIGNFISLSQPEAPLHVKGDGGTLALVDGGALAVERTDGSSPNILFATSSQDWRFQNNPNDGVFSIRDATNTTSSVRIYPGGIGSTLVVRDGRLGLRNVAPQHPIDAFNGARLTEAGVWANASSRKSKQDVERLTTEEALAALAELDPVKFAYQATPQDPHVGFIAEDVPELVAMPGRETLSSMDLVAVLTRVVQEQQRRIEEQERLLAAQAERSVARGRRVEEQLAALQQQLDGR